MQKKFLIIGIVIFASFFLIVSPVLAIEPLVPCGREGTPPCTTCDFLVLGNNVANFILFYLVPAIAALLFIWAGFQILLGGGIPSKVQAGQGIFRTTAYGLMIIFLAWLIVNTVLRTVAGDENIAEEWWKLECKEVVPTTTTTALSTTTTSSGATTTFPGGTTVTTTTAPVGSTTTLGSGASTTIRNTTTTKPPAGGTTTTIPASTTTLSGNTTTTVAATTTTKKPPTTTTKSPTTTQVTTTTRAATTTLATTTTRPPTTTTQRATTTTLSASSCPQSGTNFCQPASSSCPSNACSQYASAINSAATSAGISGVNAAALIRSIMFNESSCSISARNLISNPETGQVTESCGLMQLQPSTANTFKSQCGVTANITCDWLRNPTNANASICIGAKYLQSISRGTCGNQIRNIAAGYNGGTNACLQSNNCRNDRSCDGGNVRRWECLYDNDAHTICNTRTNHPGYNETRTYAPRVLACYNRNI